MTLPTSIFYICKPHVTLHLPSLKSSPTSPTTILYSIYLIGNIECTTYVYCVQLWQYFLTFTLMWMFALSFTCAQISQILFELWCWFFFRLQSLHRIKSHPLYCPSQGFYLHLEILFFFLHIKISIVDSRGILAHPLNTNLSYNKEQQFRPWLFKYKSFPFWVTLFYLPPQNSLNSVFGFCTPSQSLLKVSHMSLKVV